MGVPHKYKGQETCNRYVELAAQGKTDQEIASDLNVSVRVFLKWAEKYDEFRQARQLGYEKCESWWREYFRKKATGEKYNKGDFQAARWLTMNKFGWSDKTQFKLESDETTIKIEIVDPHEVK